MSRVDPTGLCGQTFGDKFKACMRQRFNDVENFVWRVVGFGAAYSILGSPMPGYAMNIAEYGGFWGGGFAGRVIAGLGGFSVESSIAVGAAIGETVGGLAVVGLGVTAGVMASYGIIETARCVGASL